MPRPPISKTFRLIRGFESLVHSSSPLGRASVVQLMTPPDGFTRIHTKSSALMTIQAARTNRRASIMMFHRKTVDGISTARSKCVSDSRLTGN